MAPTTTRYEAPGGGLTCAEDTKLVNDDVAHTRSGRAVLVVEDDQGIGKMLVALLSAEGYQPTLVTDGSQALEALRDLRPALVTLDLSLPGMDGVEVLERMDADSDRRVPVVVVSAYTDRLTAAYRARASAVLTKPFEIDTLLSCISSALAED
jgi:two-component system, OmpR family, response regulator MtrA